MGRIISKFNKKRCMSCIYKCTISGGAGVKTSPRNIACYYSVLSKEGCCLSYDSKSKKIIDRRGTDPDRCQLYEKGERERSTYAY